MYFACHNYIFILLFQMMAWWWPSKTETSFQPLKQLNKKYLWQADYIFYFILIIPIYLFYKFRR